MIADERESHYLTEARSCHQVAETPELSISMGQSPTRALGHGIWELVDPVQSCDLFHPVNRASYIGPSCGNGHLERVVTCDVGQNGCGGQSSSAPSPPSSSSSSSTVLSRLRALLGNLGALFRLLCFLSGRTKTMQLYPNHNSPYLPVPIT